MPSLSRAFRLGCLVAALLGAGALGYAQGKESAQGVGPRVLSGPDIGFQLKVTDQSKGKAIGRLVVRIDGEWREAQFEHTVTPVR